MLYGLDPRRYPGPHPFSQAFQQVSDGLWPHSLALSGLPRRLPHPVFGGSPVLPVLLTGPAFSRPVSPVLSRPGSAAPMAMPGVFGGSAGQRAVGQQSPAFSGLPHPVFGGSPVLPGFEQGYSVFVPGPASRPGSAAPMAMPGVFGGSAGQKAVGQHSPAFSGLPHPVFGGSPVLPGLEQGYGVFLPGPASRPGSAAPMAMPGVLQSPSATSWRHRWEANGQAIANMRDVLEASLAPGSPVLSPRLRPASPVFGSVGQVSPVLGVIPVPFSSGILHMPPHSHTAFQDYQDPYLGWKMADRRLLDDVLMHPLLPHINEQGIRPLFL